MLNPQAGLSRMTSGLPSTCGALSSQMECRCKPTKMGRSKNYVQWTEWKALDTTSSPTVKRHLFALYKIHFNLGLVVKQQRKGLRVSGDTGQKPPAQTSKTIRQLSLFLCEWDLRCHWHVIFFVRAPFGQYVTILELDVKPRTLGLPSMNRSCSKLRSQVKKLQSSARSFQSFIEKIGLQKVRQKFVFVKLGQEDLPFKAQSRKICQPKVRQEDLPFKAELRRFPFSCKGGSFQKYTLHSFPFHHHCRVADRALFAVCLFMLRLL